ncbi:MAG: Spy/CpxP family protein refolding chaperone [Thermosynechococcaceae cyanobacterium]
MTEPNAQWNDGHKPQDDRAVAAFLKANAPAVPQAPLPFEDQLMVAIATADHEAALAESLQPAQRRGKRWRMALFVGAGITLVGVSLGQVQQWLNPPALSTAQRIELDSYLSRSVSTTIQAHDPLAAFDWRSAPLAKTNQTTSSAPGNRAASLLTDPQFKNENEQNLAQASVNAGRDLAVDTSPQAEPKLRQGIEKVLQSLELSDEQLQQLQAVKKQYQSSIETQEQSIRAAQADLLDILAGDASEPEVTAKLNQVQTLYNSLQNLRLKNVLAIREVLSLEQRQIFLQKVKQMPEFQNLSRAALDRSAQ